MVLSASLSNVLRCITVMPNGTDVVVGGDEGYLAAFTIRYGSQLYELPGHHGIVWCVAVCSVTKRIFSVGISAIRAWEFRTVDQTGQQVGDGDVLVRHERAVRWQSQGTGAA